MKKPLTPEEQELLNRWRRHKPAQISDSVKDELRLKFKGDLLFEEPMDKHTYIKIGGKADVFLKPNSMESLITALKIARDHGVPVFFHGAGANTLVKDGGIRGFVISFYDQLKEFRVISETGDHFDIEAESGLWFSRLVHFSKEYGSSSLTPLIGIPGSVGGLVSMNAGTKEREIKDVVRSVTVLTKDLELEEISREKLEFSYRHLKLPRTHFIVKAVFRLKKDISKEETEQEIKNYQKRRQDAQPLNYPNLGSVFKNPSPTKGTPSITAGQLIEEAGLKNVRVGAARISQKHANFIINEGGASAKDVLALVDLAKEKVKELTGIVLETEIKIIGEDL